MVTSFSSQPAGRPKPALPAAPNFSPKPSPRASPRSSPRGTGSIAHTPSKQNLHDTSMGSSMVSVTPRSLNGTSWLSQTPNSQLEYTLMTGGAYCRPRPVLQSYDVRLNSLLIQCDGSVNKFFYKDKGCHKEIQSLRKITPPSVFSYS